MEGYRGVYICVRKYYIKNPDNFVFEWDIHPFGSVL